MNEASELIGEIKKVVASVLGERGVRQPNITAIDSGYAGGAPKTKDAGDSAAPDATDLVFASYAHCNIRPSDQAVKVPLTGGGFGIAGRLIEPPPGLLYTGECWLFITPGTAGSSATAITTRAQRLYNPQCFPVANVMFEITAGGAGLNARVRLYSANGVLILDTGNVDCTSTGIKTAPISPAVTIIQGNYIAKVTADSGVSWRCADLAASLAAVMNQGTNQRAADETMASGTTNVAFPIIKFQS